MEKRKNPQLLLKALLIPFAFALMVLVIFTANFYDHQISDVSSHWGEFGDYVGGLLNPIFSFFSFIAILFTIQIQTKQLKTSTEELKLSREELRLTRDELSKSAIAQHESQLALNKQAEIAYKSSELDTINFLISTYQNEYMKIINDYTLAAQERKVELQYKINTLKGIIEDTFEELIKTKGATDEL